MSRSDFVNSKESWPQEYYLTIAPCLLPPLKLTEFTRSATLANALHEVWPAREACTSIDFTARWGDAAQPEMLGPETQLKDVLAGRWIGSASSFGLEVTSASSRTTTYWVNGGQAIERYAPSMVDKTKATMFSM